MKKGTLLSFIRLFPVMAATFLLSSAASQAQSFQVIHPFDANTDGANPLNGLMMSSNGVIYGTASTGGPAGSGTVYTINPDGTLNVVYAFSGGADGGNPQGFLIEDQAGNLYGTTSGGGEFGAGTVFRITGGLEEVLYSFGAGPEDGSGPQAGLAMDTAGHLYGTTAAGGANKLGTVFKLKAPASGTQWSERILHSFGTGTDGITPVAGITLDSNGNVYGTTSAGGSHGYGTVFELVGANGWGETVIHNFKNLGDGATPYAGLVAGPTGDFFGAATDGGMQGGGTVFHLTSNGMGGWSFSVIAGLPGWGISGTFRNLLVKKSGIIYGTTHCDGANSAGTVYELAPTNGTWQYKLLYTFTGGSDGLYLFSNLVESNGILYGTTNIGGANGAGVVFAVTP